MQNRDNNSYLHALNEIICITILSTGPGTWQVIKGQLLFYLSSLKPSLLSSPHPLNRMLGPCYEGYRGCLWDPPRHELEESLQWIVERQRAGEAAERGDQASVRTQSRAPLTHCLAAASVETGVSLCFSVMAQLHPTFRHPSHHTPQADLTTRGDLHFSTDTLTLEQTIFIDLHPSWR